MYKNEKGLNPCIPTSSWFKTITVVLPLTITPITVNKTGQLA